MFILERFFLSSLVEISMFLSCLEDLEQFEVGLAQYQLLSSYWKHFEANTKSLDNGHI